MTQVVLLNGVPVPPEEATVSVFDRGFLYGDSVYEVLRTYSGVPFELDRHLDRLEASAARIGMGLPVAKSELAQAAFRAHALSGQSESYVRFVVTRGAGTLGLDPSLAVDPTWLVLALPLRPPPPELIEHGASLALVSVRRNLPSAVDPRAKTGNYLNSVLALKEAKQSGAYEAAMLDHGGMLTEGASSNIFLGLDRTLFTPPLEAGILEGITRAVVLRVASERGLRVLEVPVSEGALRAADEIFITSSIREIVPITALDGRPVGTGVPGALTREVIDAFRAYTRAYASERGA